MPDRHIYLRIEEISDYCPVDPQTPAPPNVTYRRDGMRQHGHDDGTIPQAEVQARTLSALVYREYLDSAYLIPRTSKLVAADLNEPVFFRRVPGTVIYACPGETLRIHVWNADVEPHSLHVHGLEYGIDSDGSWPFGTQAGDGRRSDAICPGESWTYSFVVRNDMIGAWPFHDHAHHADPAIRRGLFGGIVVRNRPFQLPIPCPLPPRFDRLPALLPGLPRRPVHRQVLPPPARRALEERYEFLRDWLIRKMCHPPFLDRRLHVPVFFHIMSSEQAKPVFDSGDLEENGVGTFSWTFNDPGTHAYFCRFHPVMRGTVEVVGGGPAAVTVNILDAPAMGF